MRMAVEAVVTVGAKATKQEGRRGQQQPRWEERLSCWGNLLLGDRHDGCLLYTFHL